MVSETTDESDWVNVAGKRRSKKARPNKSKNQNSQSGNRPRETTSRGSSLAKHISNSIAAVATTALTSASTELIIQAAQDHLFKFSDFPTEKEMVSSAQPTLPRSGTVHFFLPLVDNLRIKDGKDMHLLYPKAEDDTTPSKKFSAVGGFELHFTYRMIFHQIDGEIQNPSSWTAASIMMSKTSSEIREPLNHTVPVRTTLVEVEAVYDEDRGLSIDDAFDEAIRVVSNFQQGYHVVTKEPISLLTKKSLPYLVPMFVENDGTKTPSLMTVHLKGAGRIDGPAGVMSPDVVPVSDEEMSRIASILNDLSSGVFGQFINVQREALVTYHNGNNGNSIILLGSAMEIFLKEVIEFLTWEQKLSLADSGGVLRGLKKSFVKTVEDRLGVSLGGTWDRTLKEFLDWRLKVADPRNDAIHQGKIPSDLEMEEAFSAYQTFQKLVMASITDHSRTYPVTAALWGNSSGPTSFSLLDVREKMDRWKFEVDRMTANLVGDSGSHLCVLVRSYSTFDWFIWDEQKELAARIPVPEGGNEYLSPAVETIKSQRGHLPFPWRLDFLEKRNTSAEPSTPLVWEPFYKVIPHTHAYHL